MTKHATQTATLGELRTLIAGHTDTPWQDVLEIDCNDVDAYAREHADDLYEIWWPEHVSYPRYNSDATYRLVTGQRYAFKTDSDCGSIVADSFDDAKDELHKLVPDSAIEDGAWGWVEDMDGNRYEVNCD